MHIDRGLLEQLEASVEACRNRGAVLPKGPYGEPTTVKADSDERKNCIARLFKVAAAVADSWRLQEREEDLEDNVYR